MRMTRPLGLFGVGFAIAMPWGLAAQAPVAVPIVGSPMASQPNQPPAQTVPIPSQPPSLPPMGPAAQAPSAALAAAARTERKLQVSFKDGSVTLVAQNVTVRDILAEWQRRNGCQFVNADKLIGAAAASNVLIPATSSR